MECEVLPVADLSRAEALQLVADYIEVVGHIVCGRGHVVPCPAFCEEVKDAAAWVAQTDLWRLLDQLAECPDAERVYLTRRGDEDEADAALLWIGVARLYLRAETQDEVARIDALSTPLVEGLRARERRVSTTRAAKATA